MVRGLVALLCVASAASAVKQVWSGVTPASQSDGVPARASTEPLPFFYDLYTFRGPSRSTTVVAAFAVEARHLAKAEVGNEVRYRFGVSFVLADTARRTVSQTDDSVLVRVARPFADDHLLFTHIEVPAPPSTTTLQRVIMIDGTEPGIGQLYTTPFPIPDYSGSELMISDIALGHPDVNGGWGRGDVTLALLPTSRFPESKFDVYYEIYNLPAGHRYSTDIAIEPLDDAGEPIASSRPVRLRFAGQATIRRDGSLPELRRIEAPLAKGRYRITVTIIDQRTGRSANRSRSFEVHGWGPGVTMVVAVPRGGRHSQYR
jgi:hypothetical protein